MQTPEFLLKLTDKEKTQFINYLDMLAAVHDYTDDAVESIIRDITPVNE